MTQLSLDSTGETVTRSRIRSVNLETGKIGGGTLATGAAGCFTCNMENDGVRWTNRRLHAEVVDVRGLLYCLDHAEGEIRSVRARRERA